MANWNLPGLGDLYTNILTYLKDRDTDLAKGLDPAIVTVTNPATNMIRWNSAGTRWEKYNGTTWAALTATYSINAATASAWATGRTITNTGDATGVSAAFTGAGNLSYALTLATVNANVGSFGSASAVPIITVNAKGLITGVSTAALASMATQAANSVAIIGGAISATSLTLVNSIGAAPTVEGRVEWDSDDDKLKVGTGGATKTFSADDGTATITSKTFSTGCTWNGNVMGVAYGGTGAATLTGLVKGNGTGAMTAAVAGTDYLAPAAIGVTVQSYDPTTAGLAALDATAGLVEQTAADVFTKRAIGVGAGTSIPTVAHILGKHTAGIPAGAMKAHLTNGAASATIALVTNGTLVTSLNFDPNTEQFAQFSNPAPFSLDNAVALEAFFEWSHPATTTNFGAAWAVRAKFVRNDDSLDGAWSAWVQVNDVGGTTDDLYTSGAASVTPAGTYADGCTIMWEVKRVAGDATNDTLAVVARLKALNFKYTTNALNDN